MKVNTEEIAGRVRESGGRREFNTLTLFIYFR
jgi:hypothetical protein